MGLDFETRRLLRAKISEAQRAKLFASGGEKCGCGTPVDMLDPSCKRCKERHRARARRAKNLEKYGRGQCSGCGISVERHYTVGCSTCYERKRGRQRRMAA